MNNRSSVSGSLLALAAGTALGTGLGVLLARRMRQEGAAAPRRSGGKPARASKGASGSAHSKPAGKRKSPKKKS